MIGTENFNKDEKKLLATMLSTDAQLSVAIPDGGSDDDIFNGVVLSCRMLQSLNRATGRLLPILGRMLKLVRDRPDIHRDRGFDTFESFVTGQIEERLGVSRTQSYLAMKLYRSFPDLPLPVYEQVGPSKMDIISRFCDQTNTDHRSIMDTATAMTVPEFRTYCEEKGYIGQGETVGKAIHISATLDVFKVWTSWIHNPEVQKYFGTDNAAQILVGTLAECSSTILAHATPNGVSRDGT